MKKNRPQRIDEKFVEDMREAARMRIVKDLAKPVKQDISLREMTHLLTRTNGYRISLEELKTKPKGVKTP